MQDIECLLDSSGPSCDLGVTCSMESDIWLPDTVVAISEKRVRSGMMCLLNFKCRWNSVRLPVVCGPHLLGMACSRDTVWDPGGGVETLGLVACCDCLCLITLFRGILPYDLRRSCLPTLVLKDICCFLEDNITGIGFVGTVDWCYCRLGY